MRSTDWSSDIGFVETHQPAPRVAFRQPEAVREVGRGEAPAERLREPGARERVLEPAPQALRVGEAPGGAAARRHRRGQVLEAPDARDLLDEVGLARDVVAPPVRDGGVEPVVGLLDANPRPSRIARLLAGRDVDAQQPRTRAVADG